MNPSTLPAETPLSFDVTEADFRQTVLERSLEVPVLLDCWAPWCAPCRSLGPILEKLVQEYGGRFVLAKLDMDNAPQISAALQVRSIPLVVMFVGGRPVDQFAGALPESKIRAFLEPHLGAQVSPLEALRQAVAEATPADAELMLRDALAQTVGAPEYADIALDLADRVAANGELDEAQTLIDTLATVLPAAAPESGPEKALFERREALSKRLALAQNRPAGEPQAWAARVAANARDFEARFGLAAWQVFEGDYAAAFEQLLDVVLRDKAEWREKARLQLIEWFNVCPDAAAVSKGRRFLGMYLN